MRSYLVVPLFEAFFVGEGVSVFFVGVKHFLCFAVTLGMFDSAEDMLDAYGIQEGLEQAFLAFAGVVLCSMIGDALFDGPICECFFHALDGSLAGGAVAFDDA